jgi:FkbM family methyltransferase
MYVDKYRFKKEPEAIAGENDGPLRALFRGSRGKASMFVRTLVELPAVIKAYRSLRNAESRAIFRDLNKYRMLGSYYTRIAYNRELYEAMERVVREDVPFEMPEEPMEDPLGHEIRLWSVDYCGRKLQFYGSKHSIYSIRDGQQYYYDLGGVRIMPEEGDVVLDGGAFLGETAMRFAIDVGPSGRVIGFDPFPRHTAIANEVARRNGLDDRVQFVAAGLGAASSVASLDEALAPADAAAGSGIDFGRRVDSSDRVITIDDYCAWSGIDRVDFLKMDIEGFEMPALHGSHATISKWRPKLAICLYHKYRDLWQITNHIQDRYPFYDLYLGHYTLHGEETVLYAIRRKDAS